MKESTTAVLFASWHGVSIQNGGANIRKNLVEPLGADILLLLTYRTEDGCSSAETCGMLARVAGLGPVARFQVERQLTTRELANALDASPGWPPLFEVYKRTAGCVRLNESGTTRGAATPYRCKAIKEAGNIFLAPVIGNPRLNVLRQLHMQARVLRMLERHELEDRGGTPYSRVVWSRLEFMWLAPHPSVHRLQPSSCVWVPIEEDYGGINDRHALLDRTGASAYLGRWNMLLSGKVLDIAPCMRERQCTQSSERLTAATIIYHNLTVCRFPSAAFLQCCRDAHRGVCYKTACHKWHWPLQKQAVELTQNISGNISSISGKYPKEIASAVLHASAFELPGMRFRHERVLFPPKGFWYDQLAQGTSLVVDAPREEVGQWQRHREVKRALAIVQGFKWTLLKLKSAAHETSSAARRAANRSKVLHG